MFTFLPVQHIHATLRQSQKIDNEGLLSTELWGSLPQVFPLRSSSSQSGPALITFPKFHICHSVFGSAHVYGGSKNDFWRRHWHALPNTNKIDGILGHELHAKLESDSKVEPGATKPLSDIVVPRSFCGWQRFSIWQQQLPHMTKRPSVALWLRLDLGKEQRVVQALNQSQSSMESFSMWNSAHCIRDLSMSKLAVMNGNGCMLPSLHAAVGAEVRHWTECMESKLQSHKVVATWYNTDLQPSCNGAMRWWSNSWGSQSSRARSAEYLASHEPFHASQVPIGKTTVPCSMEPWKINNWATVLYLKSIVTLPDLSILPKVAVFLTWKWPKKKTHSRKDEYLTELPKWVSTVSLTRQCIILKAEFLGYRWVILQAELILLMLQKSR